MINFQLISTIVKGTAKDSNINAITKMIELPTEGTSSGKGNIITVNDDKVVFEVYDDSELLDKGIFRKGVAERVHSWLTDYYV